MAIALFAFDEKCNCTVQTAEKWQTEKPPREVIFGRAKSANAQKRKGEVRK
jgi:hypothetical protein